MTTKSAARARGLIAERAVSSANTVEINLQDTVRNISEYEVKLIRGYTRCVVSEHTMVYLCPRPLGEKSFYLVCADLDR